MTPPEPNLILELARAMHAVIGAFEHDARPVGLGPPEANVLANLTALDGAPVSGIGAASGYKASTLTSVLDRLERRALVVRRPHATDRRSVTVHLTRDGRALARKLRAALDDLDRRVRRTALPGAAEGFRSVTQAIVALTALRARSSSRSARARQGDLR
jgi:MarR family transcriptional regulator, organic hydroperoxide resistance regulator